MFRRRLCFTYDDYDDDVNDNDYDCDDAPRLDDARARSIADSAKMIMTDDSQLPANGKRDKTLIQRGATSHGLRYRTKRT